MNLSVLSESKGIRKAIILRIPVILFYSNFFRKSYNLKPSYKMFLLKSGTDVLGRIGRDKK